LNLKYIKLGLMPPIFEMCPKIFEKFFKLLAFSKYAQNVLKFSKRKILGFIPPIFCAQKF
jgi:hypothetical protein